MTDETSGTAAPADEASTVKCTECHSKEVRPSRSSYPQDTEKIGSEGASFWRCGNCGSRFLGPFVAPSSSRRKKQAHKDALPKLDRDIQFARRLKRWIFPAIVILLTVLAVIYLLDQRDSGALPAVLN